MISLAGRAPWPPPRDVGPPQARYADRALRAETAKLPPRITRSDEEPGSPRRPSPARGPPPAPPSSVHSHTLPCTSNSPNPFGRKLPFPPDRGGPYYTKRAYRHALDRACARASVPSWCPLQLRHSFATRLRKAGGVEDAQVLLGHKRVESTQVERDLERAVELARKLG